MGDAVMQEQWERVDRWRQLVAETHLNGRSDKPPEMLNDEMHALCQAVWHLKDWTKRDTAGLARAGVTAAEVSAFAHGTPELLIVKELANGTKHGQLNYRLTQNQSVNVVIGTPHIYRLDWTVETDTGPRDAYAVVVAAIGQWKVFISAHPALLATTP